MCTNSAAFTGLLGAVCGHIVELEGPKGLFGTGKSGCLCRVATISLYLAVFNSSRAVSGKKRLILALNCRF